ncbi:MAG: aminotransferase class V-fold PLP-dependent enzyme, partial [Saprospiraceae bacterium]
TMRDEFEKSILSEIEYAGVNGHLEKRLHTVSNIKIEKVDSQAIMTRLRTKIAISSGSACSSADPSPSHVLLSMGLTEDEAKGSFRISMGTPTTHEDIRTASRLLVEAIGEYRSESPVWQMFMQGIDVNKPGYPETKIS